MIEALQQNEGDFSCHSSLLGSVRSVEKSSSICYAEGLITGLIFIALFPPTAQSAHCTKQYVCSRIQDGNSVLLSVFRESAVQISKCKIKYHFYKKAQVPRVKSVKCRYGLHCMICAETEYQLFGLTLRSPLVDATFFGSSFVNRRQMNACG